MSAALCPACGIHDQDRRSRYGFCAVCTAERDTERYREPDQAEIEERKDEWRRTGWPNRTRRLANAS